MATPDSRRRSRGRDEERGEYREFVAQEEEFSSSESEAATVDITPTPPRQRGTERQLQQSPLQQQHYAEAPPKPPQQAGASCASGICPLGLALLVVIMAAFCAFLTWMLVARGPERPGPPSAAGFTPRPEGPVKPDQGAIGWLVGKATVGDGHWCRVGVPADNWTLAHCVPASPGNQLRVKLLTYNLFWWNLFLKRKGNDGSAGKLIAAAAAQAPIDLMGFQECNDAGRVIRDAKEAGLPGVWRTMGPVNPVAGAVAIAWRDDVWQTLNFGLVDVAEDSPEEWWGVRYVAFVRLVHMSSKKTIFFMNHHGPLPVAKPGGLCGADATAYNLLKVAGYHALPGDTIILVGDFNAGKDSGTIARLSQYMGHVYNGNVYGGVDNVFASCATAIERKNLGSGGSDHEALSVVLQLP